MATIWQLANMLTGRIQSTLQVRDPVKTQSTISVKPTYVPTTSLSVRPTSGTNYNPQRSGSSTYVQQTYSPTRTTYNPQGGTYSPQKAYTPPPPPKYNRTYTTWVYNSKTNTFEAQKLTKNVTNAQWQRQVRIEAEQRRLRAKFEKLRLSFQDSIEFKAQLVKLSQQYQQAFAKRAEIMRKQYEKQLGALAQAANNANDVATYNKYYNLYQQTLKRGEIQLRNLEETATAWDNVARQEFDRNDAPDTRSIWDIPKKVIGKAYDYTLGEKSPFDIKRAVNTGLNFVNPQRKVFKHGEDHNLAPRASDFGGGLRGAWNASQSQRYRATQDLSGLDATGRTTIRTLDAVFENALDPNWWIGAGATRKAATFAGGRLGLGKVFGKLDDLVGSTKLGRGVKWLNKPHVTWREKNADKLQALRKQNSALARSQRNAFISTKKKAFAQAVRKLKKPEWRTIAPDVNWKTLDNIEKLDDKVVELAQRIRLTAPRWGEARGDFFPDLDDKALHQWKRGLTKGQVRQADDLARQMSLVAERMYGADNSWQAVAKRRNYIPHHRDIQTDFRKAKRVNNEFNYGVGKALQTPEQLQQSIDLRTYKSMWDKKKPGVWDRGVVTRDKVVEKARSSNLWDDFERNDELASGLMQGNQRSINKLAEKQGALNTINKLNPMRAWRGSVLALRPQWWENNEIFNQLSGITGGGVKFIKNQKGWKKYVAKLTPEQQKDVASGLGKEAGFFRKAASRQEGRARAALYKTFRDEGMDHDAAVKRMNRWLFDYETKNFERPLRVAMPFYHFNKGAVKRMVSMPLETPRGAMGWKKAYQTLYEQPLKQLPDEDQVIQNKDTGETSVYNPRKANAGKLYNPFTKEWVTTPWNPFAPLNADDVSKNPVLTAWDEWATNRDSFGNPLDGVTPAENILRQFPQFNLAKQTYEWMNRSQFKPTERWLAQGSALPKEAQGYDSTKANYRKSLDPGATLRRRWQSYMGASFLPGGGTKFDAKAFEKNQRTSKFLDEWFGTDFTKIKDYKQKTAAQEAVAKKYGFDLQKDIYGGLFTKNDTPFSKRVKRMKGAAADKTSEFWKGYHATPKGTPGKVSERTIYLNQKRVEWEEDNSFKKNPYFGEVLKDYFVNKKRPDAQRAVRELTFWKRYFDLSEGQRQAFMNANPDMKAVAESARQAKMAAYRNTPKGKFWETYFNLSKSERSAYYEKNFRPEYGGKSKYGSKRGKRGTLAEYRRTEKGMFWDKFFSIKDTKERLDFYADEWEPGYGGKGLKGNSAEDKFWVDYYNANPDQREAMLAAHPQFSKFEKKKRTSAEWDKIRADKRAKEKALFKGADSFNALAKKNEADIWASYNPRLPAQQRRIIWKTR